MGKSKSNLVNIPIWKKWLSHLFEITIEQTGSEINPELTVCLDRGRLQLYTENAIYSFQDLYDNFTQVFHRLDFKNFQPENILLLGFGMGSIPYTLEHKFEVTASYVGLEIDEEVIRLASKYGLPTFNSPCTLICADAYSFVEMSEEQFDMIVVDLFIDNVIPSRFEEIFFLENVQELLTPNGLLLYNRLTAADGDKDAHKAFFETRFSPIFREASGITVEDNTILMNTPIYLKS